VAIRVVSFVVIIIIAAVMANTMAMSARERWANTPRSRRSASAPASVADDLRRIHAAGTGGRGHRHALLFPAPYSSAKSWAPCSPCFRCRS
jgi:Ni/Co efflux regulator RcnB